MSVVDAVVEIPKEVDITVTPEAVTVKGAKGEVSIPLSKKLSLNRENDSLKIVGPKMFVNTCKAHILNAIKGVMQGHEMKMSVLYSHFPIKIEVKGNEIHIKNFLGAKVDRIAKVVGNTQVKVKGKEVIIQGPDIYGVGQTAANLRGATRIRGKDERIFQDGIYLVRE